ncbi:hypothetical protein F2P81_019470 [Scophthalmus maximus]|uniref:Uncharacterized protein n=1 Tax=Scophthalmus maximus TaxID=52904 RepID=A0A6A4S219_SCOMX|nr:hypothetical protein F2P81_019470 [Scophthalmus maximus]
MKDPTEPAAMHGSDRLRDVNTAIHPFARFGGGASFRGRPQYEEGGVSGILTAAEWRRCVAETLFEMSPPKEAPPAIWDSLVLCVVYIMSLCSDYVEAPCAVLDPRCHGNPT